MCSDCLSEKEEEYTARVLKILRAVGWASPLLRRIDVRGGITAPNQPLLFEARFAYELFRRGKQVHYEYPMIAEEEKKIRKDPAGSTSSLISKVFGAIGK